MQSLLFDCCYPSGMPEGSNIHHMENLREFVRQDAARMDIDQPLSPKDLDRREINHVTPPRSHRGALQCPDAPKKKPRDPNNQDGTIYPSNSFASVPLFPFEGFDRTDSMDSTITVSPRRLFDLEPKFNEPTLVDDLYICHAHLIMSDEEREPVNEEKEEEETRQKQFDSETRSA